MQHKIPHRRQPLVQQIESITIVLLKIIAPIGGIEYKLQLQWEGTNEEEENLLKDICLANMPYLLCEITKCLRAKRVRTFPYEEASLFSPSLAL